jgi:hypothetical protein
VDPSSALTSPDSMGDAGSSHWDCRAGEKDAEFGAPPLTGMDAVWPAAVEAGATCFSKLQREIRGGRSKLKNKCRDEPKSLLFFSA